MTVFVEVAERGSLTAAAEALGMSRAMVSRHLAALETWLGARVLHRTTRRIGLTPAGEIALERCRRMLAVGEEMQAALGDADGAPHGRVRVACSTSFGVSHMATAVADFVRRHPGTAVDVVLADRAANLAEERIDIAIRIARALEPGLIARRITTCRSAVCASPDYLAAHGTPRQPQDLAGHNCLTHHYVGKGAWTFDRDGRSVSVVVEGTISANDATLLAQSAKAGAGIAFLPTYLVAPMLRSGELVALLPGYRPEEMGIHAVYLSRRQMPRVVRAFIDFLAERFGDVPEWDRGWGEEVNDS
ncbi:LysR family transcriptional regulator [Marilutibacter alkalisoli]|nr:LysR family transcriptional regulator [Lysobacter alkalisoli]